MFEKFIGSPTSLKENFNFDGLDRLYQIDQINPANNITLQTNGLQYDERGNITHKDDAGDLIYNVAAKPFTLTYIDNATGNISPYTLNVNYNDFDKVKQLAEMTTNKQLDVVYGNNDNRIKVDYSISGVNQYTRYYAENYDRQESGSNYKEWTYIFAPSGLCAVNYNNNGSSQLNYVLADHLGSPVLLTNTSGNLVEELSFDAWGRRRNPTDWSYNAIPTPSTMIRGFTLHEHIDEFALINMNGRVYDPVIGRFVQPDNYIQAPEVLQNYNRYAYCLNNPLKYVDPTGYSWDDYYVDPTGQVKYDESIHSQKDLNDAGIEVNYIGPTAQWLTTEGYLAIGDVHGNVTEWIMGLPEVEFKVDRLERNYGGDGSGSVLDQATYVADQINQYNPLANIWDLLNYAIYGTDRLGNKISQGEAWMKTASIIPIGKIGSTTANSLSHIFRNAAGHVNPTTIQSQVRYMNLFENVASKADNLVPTTNAAANVAGVQTYNQTYNAGVVWVQTLNGEIRNAGVNYIKR